MTSRYFFRRIALFVAGGGLVGLSVSACNKQANPAGNVAAAEAPPIAALPLAAAAIAPAAPAPLAGALPPPSHPISYRPTPSKQRYRYVDKAYWMGDAFADTPPDYTVDYEGSRPWIWRARNGGYRIVERLPRGERIYYYDPGQDQPFLVRDPDYSYAYDGGLLVGVYGPDGADVGAAMAAQRADEAGRYYERSRDLYRAAQYQRRQAAYANEWVDRRGDLRSDHRLWQQQQWRNRDWRSWHDAHQSEELAQWGQERDQRLAYAAAIGIAASAPPPNAETLARRQAAYFASRSVAHGQAPTASGTAAPATPPPSIVAQERPHPGSPIMKSPPAPAQPNGNAPSATASAQVKAAQVAQAQQVESAVKLKEAAASQAKAEQAARALQAAADQKRKEAAAAQASAVHAAEAQKAARQAKQDEAVAAKATAAQALARQKAAAEARQKDAAAAQTKAAQAAQVQKAAAEAKQKEAAAAEAKAAQARRAAADAQRKEAEAAQQKAAAAEKAQVESRQREALAAQAKQEQTAHAQKPAGPAQKPVAPVAKESRNDKRGKHEGKSDQPDKEQRQ